MNIFRKLVLAVSIFSSAMAVNAGQAEVKIINESTHAVWYIYTSVSGSKFYGSTDLLDGEVILPGTSKIVDFDVPDAEGFCVQDVRAVNSRGAVWQKTINVCKTTTWTLYN